MRREVSGTLAGNIAMGSLTGFVLGANSKGTLTGNVALDNTNYSRSSAILGGLDYRGLSMLALDLCLDGKSSEHKKDGTDGTPLGLPFFDQAFAECFISLRMRTAFRTGRAAEVVTKGFEPSSC